MKLNMAEIHPNITILDLSVDVSRLCIAYYGGNILMFNGRVSDVAINDNT